VSELTIMRWEQLEILEIEDEKQKQNEWRGESDSNTDTVKKGDKIAMLLGKRSRDEMSGYVFWRRERGKWKGGSGVLNF